MIIILKKKHRNESSKKFLCGQAHLARILADSFSRRVENLRDSPFRTREINPGKERVSLGVGGLMKGAE